MGTDSLIHELTFCRCPSERKYEAINYRDHSLPTFDFLDWIFWDELRSV